MKFLDRLGKKTFDAIDSAVQSGERVRRRLAPLAGETWLGKLLSPGDERFDTSDVPVPEQNASPFGNGVAPKRDE